MSESQERPDGDEPDGLVAGETVADAGSTEPGVDGGRTADDGSAGAGGDDADDESDDADDDDADDDADDDDADDDADDDDADDDDADDDDDEEPGTLVSRLEREGDIAADYLEELLDIADLDGDIDLDVENDRAMVSIVGTGLGDLVGPHGAVLDALQDLTRLAVLRATGERSRLMLDVAGTRATRRDQLTRVGNEAVERAREGGEPVRLDPMTPFERKVVHDAVAAAGLRSESEGVEPNRRVVVLPS